MLDLGELKMIMASLNAPVSTKQAKQMMAEARPTTLSPSPPLAALSQVVTTNVMHQQLQ